MPRDVEDDDPANAFGIVRQVMPYLGALLVVWLLVALVPELSTWLVQFAGLGGAGSRL